jgi:methylglutaconyl-CoA hydratase
MPNVVIAPGPITRVTLDRPDVRNALNEVLVAELAAWAADVAKDASVRAVVLAGAGPVFSAGADLAWMSRMADATLEENLADAAAAARLFHLLDTLPVPVIARVHGAALGGGAGLVAVSDIVVSADDAVFGFTETTLGIVPAMIAPYVVRKIGLSAARRVCLPGVRFGAPKARDIGLVHEVVPARRLDAAVEACLAEIDRAAPSAVRATKRLLADVAGRSPGDVLALTVDAIARQRMSPEGRAGMRAFFDRRPAPWVTTTAERATNRAAGPSKPRRRPRR